jgi:hypothetical protein
MRKLVLVLALLAMLAAALPPVGAQDSCTISCPGFPEYSCTSWAGDCDTGGANYVRCDGFIYYWCP